MTLIKTTIWTGFSSLIKVITTYIVLKVIAVYTGPVGLAVLEQFRNFIEVSRSFSGSLNQGIVKYIAEYKHDEENKSRILSSALTTYLIFSIVITLFLFFFNEKISLIFFHSLEYKMPIMLLGFSISLYSLNNFLLSVLNGEFEIKKYVTCNIVNTIMIFILTVYLVVHYGIQGGLIGFILNQSIALLLTIYLVVKSKWFKFNSYVQGFDKEKTFKLLSYATMTLVQILVLPVTSLILRKYIANSLSWQEAGYWQGIMKLSDGYLVLMELVLTVYFLPKFSSIKTLPEFKTEIIYTYKFIVPIIISGLMCVFILKKQIVNALYSQQFFPMLGLFKYQLIGDMTRMSTWPLINIMLARAMIKTLVLSEIFSNILYVLLTVIFVHYFGLIGASISFSINHVIYFFVMLYITLKCIKKSYFQFQI